MKAKNVKMMLFLRLHRIVQPDFSTQMGISFGESLRKADIIKRMCNSTPNFALYNKLYTQISAGFL